MYVKLCFPSNLRYLRTGTEQREYKAIEEAYTVLLYCIREQPPVLMND